MSSAERGQPTELTAKTTIRNRALELFAEHGYNGVSLRDIAAAADVSPALIVHHFGSKAGLKQQVDDYAIALVTLLSERHADPEVAARMAEQVRKFVQKEGCVDFTDSLAAIDQTDLPWPILGDSPLLAYLRRLLIEDDDASRTALVRMHTTTVTQLHALHASGHINAGSDPATRAAVLLAHDLASLLLRGPLTRILGVDPLSKEGAEKWATEVQTIYHSGLIPTAQAAPGQDAGSPPGPGSVPAAGSSSEPGAAPDGSSASQPSSAPDTSPATEPGPAAAASQTPTPGASSAHARADASSTPGSDSAPDTSDTPDP